MAINKNLNLQKNTEKNNRKQQQKPHATHHRCAPRPGPRRRALAARVPHDDVGQRAHYAAVVLRHAVVPDARQASLGLEVTMREGRETAFDHCTHYNEL